MRQLWPDPFLVYTSLVISGSHTRAQDVSRGNTQVIEPKMLNVASCIRLALASAGTYITAAAHVVTAVIGSGVLSLAWALSTMGWIAGPLILFSFAFVTWWTSLMLADAYRYPKDTGPRNYTYPGAVRAILGQSKSTISLEIAHVQATT